MSVAAIAADIYAVIQLVKFIEDTVTAGGQPTEEQRRFLAEGAKLERARWEESQKGVTGR